MAYPPNASSCIGGSEAGGKDRVDGVALAVSEEVPAHSVIVLAMPDDRFDGSSAFELAFDSIGHASFLALGVDLELMLFRGIVAFVAGIREDAGKGCPGRALDAGKDRFQRMPVIGVFRQRFGVNDELAAF